MFEGLKMGDMGKMMEQIQSKAQEMQKMFPLLQKPVAVW